MLRILHIVAIATAALGLACKPAAAPVAVGEKPISINDVRLKDAPRQAWKPVPEMNWVTFEGTVQKVRDFHGKVLVLDFWATYCVPCKEAIPHFLELQARYPNDIRVIGLHVGGAEDRPKVPAFVEELKIDYPLAVPEDELTRYVFGDETAIPQTAVFDREGKFVSKIVGFNDEIRKEIDDLIEKTIRQ
jgi:cytochrome c biogenesis protein CcmG, thiol:disulfide interchange protein DsbE